MLSCRHTRSASFRSRSCPRRGSSVRVAVLPGNVPARPGFEPSVAYAAVVPEPVLAPVPVGHVHADDVVALLLEEERGDRGVHAAGHADRHRRALPAPPSQQGRRRAQHRARGKLARTKREEPANGIKAPSQPSW